ncbi:hypothetical protein, partial [Bacillus benzoevorans]|uniref:hypothetical protein n=1 Tax=Bacillus benzoevorans TaxID=1456 RepID=UPI0035F0D270
FCLQVLRTIPHGNALPVSYTLPPLRRVRDFHPLVRCAAKRTKAQLSAVPFIPPPRFPDWEKK